MNMNTGGPRQASARRWRRSSCALGTRLWCAQGRVRRRPQAGGALAYRLTYRSVVHQPASPFQSTQQYSHLHKGYYKTCCFVSDATKLKHLANFWWQVIG